MIKVLLKKKYIIPMGVTLMVGILFYFLPFFLFQDKVLVKEVSLILRHNLKKMGLATDIQNIYWNSLDHLTASGIRLEDIDNHSRVITADYIHIKLDLLALLKNSKSPEKVLREIELVEPRINMTRYQDGSWSFLKYFMHGKKQPDLNTVVRIRNGSIIYQDFDYGKYTFKRIDGLIDMRAYPALRWEIQGNLNIGKDLKWRSSGNTNVSVLAGLGTLNFTKAPLAKLAKFLPPIANLRLKSGLANGRLSFGWTKEKFWVNSGTAKITEARVYLPEFKQELRVEDLQADITPDSINIKKADLAYKKSKALLSGQINLKELTLNLAMNSGKINLGELSVFFPDYQKYNPSGLTRLDLKIAGKLDAPRINGTVSFEDAGMKYDNFYKFSGINGKIELNENNLAIRQIKGFWNDGIVQVDGKIFNLFEPRFDITFNGLGINTKNIYSEQVSNYGFEISKQINFTGHLTGTGQHPVLNGSLQADRIKYQEFVFDDAVLDLEWDLGYQNLQLTMLKSDLPDGQLSAQGTVKISSELITWDISAKINGAKIESTSLGKDSGIKGTISTDAVFKGSWKIGQPFNPGLAFGTFSGKQICYQDTYLNRIQGVFNWAAGKLTVESFQIKADQGDIFGDLIWDNSELLANISIEKLKIRDIFPDAKKYPLDGIFTGNIALKGLISNLSATVDGDLRTASWEAQPIGDIYTDLKLANGVWNIANVHLTNRSGTYQATGEMTWDEQPNLGLRVTGHQIALNKLLEWVQPESKLDLSGVADVTMEITGNVSDPHFSAVMNIRDPAFQNIKMDSGQINIEGYSADWHLKKLLFKNSQAIIEAAGSCKQQKMEIVFHSNFEEIEPFNLSYQGNGLSGEAELKGKITGELNFPVVQATINSSHLSLANLKDHQLNAEILWSSNQLEIKQAVISGTQGRLELAGKVIQQDQLHLDLGVKAEKYQLKELLSLFKLNQINADGDLSGTAQINGTFEKPLIRLMGNLEAGHINQLPVTGDFNLFYTGNDLNIQKIELKQDDGVLYARGLWEDGKSLKVYGFLTRFPLAVVNSFINQPNQARLEGNIDALVSLEWSGSRIRGDYRLSTGKIKVFDQNIDSMILKGGFTEKGILINEGTIDKLPGHVRLDGYLPWPKQIFEKINLPVLKTNDSQGMNLNVSLQKVPSELINLNQKEYFVSQGEINGNLLLKGDPLNPLIYGEIGCDQVEILIPGLPTINNLQANIDIERNKVKIVKAQGLAQSGKFSINGDMELNQFKPSNLNFEVSGKKIYYKNAFFEGLSDFNLKLTGPLEKTIISGEMLVYESKLSIGLTSKKQVEYWQPDLDVTIKTGKNVRYRQIGIADVTVNGTIKATGNISNPTLEGRITSSKGVISLYGQSFKINRGLALFRPTQGFYPYLEVESNIITPKAEIILNIKGQVDTNLSINLTSQPNLPQNEIYALLNWSEFNGEKPVTIDGVLNSNLSFVTDSLFGDIFYEVRSQLHLDYLYLEADYVLNNYRLNVGDFVTDQLYVSYSRSIMSNQPNENWNFDYYLSPSFVAGGTYSTEEGNSWRLTYRISF